MLAPHRSAGSRASFRNNSTDENASVQQRSSKNLDDAAAVPRAFGTQLSGNTPMTKTPAKNATKRRALGDISNRKQPGLSTRKADIQKSVVQQQTPSHHRSNGASFVLPKSTTTLVPKISNMPTTTSIAPTPLTKRVVSFAALPKQVVSKAEERTKPVATTTPAPKIFIDNFQKVQDVELPAGRLWIQEPEEEDDYNDVGIMQEVQNFKKQWAALEEKEIQENLEWKLEQYKRKDDKLTEQVEAMWNEMDDLVDGMDQLMDEEDEIISLGLDGYFSDDDSLFNPNDISL